MLRIPADSKAMKYIEKKWPEKFKNDPRSVRLGLAIDGVNPFSNQTSNYSCWSIVIINYNIPPWMSIGKENLMLAIIVPRKK